MHWFQYTVELQGELLVLGKHPLPQKFVLAQQIVVCY